MKSKHCEWCDHTFETKISYQIYCSSECREAATKEKIMARYQISRRKRDMVKKENASLVEMIYQSIMMKLYAIIVL